MPGDAEDLPPAIRKLGRHFRLTEAHIWDGWYATGADVSHRSWRSDDTDSGLVVYKKFENLQLCRAVVKQIKSKTSQPNRQMKKKNAPNKVKKNGRRVSYEAANTLIDDDSRTCTGTKETESIVQLMACVEQTNPCSSSRITVGYNEACQGDIAKMDKEIVYANEQEESGCGDLCSAKVLSSSKAEDKYEHETYQFHANMSNPVKADSPVRENGTAEVLQLNKEMLGQNSVDNKSRFSSAEIFMEGGLSTIKDQLSGETPSTSHDNKDVDHETCLSSAEPSPVDNNPAQKSDSSFYFEYGDWRVLWDPFYSRYYFYNILTQESTWYPPHGLEDFASHSSICIPEDLDEFGSQNKSIPAQEHDQAGGNKHLDEQGQDCYSELSNLSDIPDGERINQCMVTITDEAHHADNIQNDSSMSEISEMNQEIGSTKKKKRVRRSKSYHSCQDLAGNISNDIAKYWTQRYSLFSLFDSGIKMDEEGWFSVTPELIAKHHASRVGAGVVIDCFTGVGGNAIHFANKCRHVIAIDIDPQKIDCAQHNATVYGVLDHIDFVRGDFIHVAPRLKGETVFMSPPWGGPDYAKVDVYDIKTMLKPCDGLVPSSRVVCLSLHSQMLTSPGWIFFRYSLFKLGTSIASRVVMFLPRNIDQNQLADMCLSVDPPWAVEVEKNFLNGKLKAITAYFEQQDGSDVQDASDTNPQNPEYHA
uniref:Trimethylguanosine synthase n=1 Tax=Oryza punctata TaxID=4537 RepID=A0A0E0KEQ4_ORYPU